MNELARICETEAQLLEEAKAGLREFTFIADIISGPRDPYTGG